MKLMQLLNPTAFFLCFDFDAPGFRESKFINGGCKKNTKIQSYKIHAELFKLLS